MAGKSGYPSLSGPRAPAVHRLRIHPVDSGTMVEWLPNSGDPASDEVVTYEAWLAGRATPTFNPGVWLTVEHDSHVIKIEHLYVP